MDSTDRGQKGTKWGRSGHLHGYRSWKQTLQLRIQMHLGSTDLTWKEGGGLSFLVNLLRMISASSRQSHIVT